MIKKNKLSSKQKEKNFKPLTTSTTTHSKNISNVEVKEHNNSESVESAIFDNKKRNRLTTQDYIGIAGVFVNVILILLTLGAIIQTKKSVKIAAEALSDARKKDSSEQMQYQIENKAYVQITNLTLDKANYTLNRKLVITFDIINLGKSPAKIKDGHFNVAVGKKDSSAPVGRVENNIISSISSIRRNFRADAADNAEYRATVIGEKGFVVWGEIRYESMVTKNEFLYSFEFVIKVSPELDVQTLVNDEKQL